MTSDDIAAVLGAGRGAAIGYLSRLRPSDLEDIARQRGVTFTRETPAGELARSVVDRTAERAKAARRARGARR
jgi:hypothetical protein